MREVVIRKFICDSCGYIKDASNDEKIPDVCPSCSDKYRLSRNNTDKSYNIIK